ncbi:MAG: D-alanyl-D-alanine carboxypeptidase [Clostridia bacterium]|nr:D-alanyl-D-alanine carboxypeptidase [Clostridia bacterium]
MKIKKILPLFLLMAILAANISSALAAPVAERPWDEYVSGGELRDRAVSSADAAILVEANSGRILFEKRSTYVMEPASITKIMTAILGIENSNMSDIVTIDNTMAEIIVTLDGASKCGFQKNESIYMEDLLYGLMLLSGADAAVAIAIHVGGTYDNFIQMMNDKAQELGMTKTVFKNVHGLHDSGHVTCAEDMAKLAQYALKFPAFAKIVSTSKYTPTDTDKHSYSEKGQVWRNSNLLISPTSSFGYDYATGVKTGFTTPAGHTLVSSAEQNGVSLIGVVLKDSGNGKWVNSITMFEYGFKYWDTIDIAAEYSETEIEAEVENASPDANGETKVILQLAPVEKVYLTEKIDLIEEIRADIDEYFTVDIQYYDGALTAPVKKGEEVGVITYTYIYDHYYSDYLTKPGDDTNGIKKIQYKAYLIASNTVDALPTVTPEPTAAPEVTPLPEVTGNITDAGNKTSRILLYTAIGLLAIVATMIVSSGLTRRYKYQQYYKTDKVKKEKPKREKRDNDKVETIKFNY